MLYGFRLGFICVLTGALVSVSCGGSSDGVAECGDLPPYREFVITDYDISTRHHSEPVTTTTYVYGEATTTEPVPWNHLGIQLESQANVYVAREATTRWSLFPTANACSPVPPQPTQTIQSIEIVSDNAYTDAYPAGTDLAAIMNRYGDDYGVHADSVSAYIAEQPPARRSLNLFFTQAPQYERHTFTITIELDDGNVFVKDTPEVYLEVQDSPGE
ncbi:hypothetical protein [Gilvimarinus xylanilyticus]|uniref:Lipoprotein n=1 Tax=Gilvimarinus xylanilyticus TaxID=2944139 RepID=A0A9X2KVB2_9GAMM|nr:hypothetical protein [Gilvimarinus xylanilyticus]MCP8901017.1 hypothetical protein [Gilvimarinus xylanilyticus]